MQPGTGMGPKARGIISYPAEDIAAGRGPPVSGGRR